MARRSKPIWQTRAEALAILILLKAPLVLPFALRRCAVAWLMRNLVSPLAGYSDRIRANLDYVCPDLPEAEKRRLIREVPGNVGRMLIELASGDKFLDLLRDEPITGPGVAALEQAKAEGRPIIVVSGHFGNFDAIRGALALRGYKIGALYRPLDDPRLETAFHTMLTHIADPVFPRGRSGLGQMLRFLKKGNTIALLLDQYVHEAAPLSFFGKPAPTSLSAAEMALKYKALLIPVYGIRRADGSFELRIESEIPHSSAPVMTQALNDDLERMIRAHMDQWLWIHRRWKPERQAKRRKRS